MTIVKMNLHCQNMNQNFCTKTTKLIILEQTLQNKLMNKVKQNLMNLQIIG